MSKEKFEKEKIVKYWLESSDDDFETMEIIYKAKRFSWSLFIGHLMLEKLFKAYYVQKREEYPPMIHNLLRLAEQADLSLSEQQKKDIATITVFNIRARYDDYKLSFQKKCTSEFTSIWIAKLKDFRLWMKEQIKA